jgi:hypothetical protein
MDEKISLGENSEGKKRPFSNFIDLVPLEHSFIGSTFTLENGRFFNPQELKANQELASNIKFLLKPYGLTTESSSLEEIVRKRVEKGKLTGWFNCFETSIKGVIVNYDFSLNLSMPDENGLIPNEFKFKFRKNFVELEKLEGEDLNVFNSIKVTQPFFSLEKDQDERILTIRFVPYQKNTQE